jgi:hypothetical protein
MTSTKQANLHGGIERQHSALLHGLYREGQCPLRNNAISGRNESI